MAKIFEPLVTCIVPVYNAEKYLEEAVNSLLGQSYKNIEILLVDDHSTDDSWRLCQEYAQKNQRVTALQTKANSGGPLEGRRLGVKKAKGEWLTFMDCDDYVLKDYVQHLIEGTQQGKYDISVTGHSLLYEDGTIVAFEWKDYTQPTSKRLNEFYKHFVFGNYHTDPADTIGQTLVRSSIAKEANLDSIPNNIYAEDTVMALAFLAESERGVNFVDHHDFVWRQIRGSGSHGGFYRRADRDAFYDTCIEIFSRDRIKEVINSDYGKVSVIVPIYNVEKQLNHCLQSILKQTYSNIEIILVDDKSPDNSGKIADDYANKDNRVKVIHKSRNEGLNMARATGFSASSGGYVMFVDSDDLIARDCVEYALRAIVKNKSEFAKFNVQTFSDVKDLPTNLQSSDELNIEKVLSGKKDLYRSRFTNKMVGVSRVTVWGGLYRHETVDKIDWERSNFRQHEDVYWTMMFLEHVDKGVFLSRKGYFYRIDNSKAVLSKSFLGNTLNGKPVGHLQFADDYLRRLYEYNKKYELGIEEEIEGFMTWQWLDRLSRLSKAKQLTSENNLDYLPQAIDAVVTGYEKLKDHNAKQAEVINDAIEEREQLHREMKTLENENRNLKNELRSHLSVKRSARLLLGNTKRRIQSMIK